MVIIGHCLIYAAGAAGVTVLAVDGVVDDPPSVEGTVGIFSNNPSHGNAGVAEA